MADCKRASPTIVAINDSSPNGTSISKKRKITPSASQLLASEMPHQIPNSLTDSPEKAISLVNSVNSAVSVTSNEIHTDHSPLTSSFSSGKLTENDRTPLDPELKTKGFETVDSNATKRNLKSFREEDIDEFFARFEREEQKRFAEKYNFDIVRDLPLEGRYEWVRLH
ncbi:cyclin-dependent kinase inhibitor 7-like protein [Trifolium pratense]|uniref:Cyclin-dependent kinase inhibitor 7-like protein n=2 Tax=Trifolium pratense TaxID=57577 RepID=A0A2K3MY16_TRIPR|nr:cyclin-dependent kinase inhibitor 7-like [Trifolium pratense]PNX95698.1 cyclin-dependent kinase inhibitor 7-like protein [Trifolium pratense]CAJ2654126.1 unnamed protein product [Trifolium pratense]